MGTIHQHGRLEKNAAMWSSCRWIEVKMGRTFKEKTLTFKEVMQKIENDVNEAIVAGLAMTHSFEKAGTDEWKNIASKFDPKEMPEVMRIVTIEGLDVNPCCGTHVKNLAQLRSLRVLNTEIARGAFRVWFVAGDRVNRAFTRMLKNEHAMTKLLSSAPNDHASRTEKLLLFQKNATKELKTLKKELAASIARDLVTLSNEGALTTVVRPILRSCRRFYFFCVTRRITLCLFLRLESYPEMASSLSLDLLSSLIRMEGLFFHLLMERVVVKKWSHSRQNRGLSKVDILVAKLQELRLQQ
ncbi:hypothetical protein PsorP6_008887 [Peronosclerospora sorghi]|uniref:Uncharacterized protein n=1 Tax=Peronosclerospora sorghi TaxID=230839 RepID=A0ACC0W042_9STRA|nr:hypothetical protein PsorP6_008887 [Peronosclerospora sorghi]